MQSSFPDWNEELTHSHLTQNINVLIPVSRIYNMNIEYTPQCYYTTQNGTKLHGFQNGLTCLGAEKSLTQRNIVTGVAGWNVTVLLLPAFEAARLPSKLRRLDELSIAILDGWGTQTHERSEIYTGRFITK